jgi:hypothetical protein
VPDIIARSRDGPFWSDQHGSAVTRLYNTHDEVDELARCVRKAMGQRRDAEVVRSP